MDLGINCSGCEAMPDLITGYAYNGMGIVTVQHGNPEASRPKTTQSSCGCSKAIIPIRCCRLSRLIFPESPDFLEVGDFNYDNRKDVLAGTSRGGLSCSPETAGAR